MPIPALTLSGGRLSEFGGHKAAKEFRVWVRPFKGGDDYYYRFKTYSQAVKGRARIVARKEGRVEKVIAVVLNPKYKTGMDRYSKYREVGCGPKRRV